MIDKTIKLNEDEQLLILITDELNMWYKNKDGHQYAYLEHEDVQNSEYYIQEAIKKFNEGYIQCSYCGEWILKEKAHHVCPAGCSCDKCYDKARDGESEFLNMLD